MIEVAGRRYRREGMLVLAVWLIGIGVIFLLRDLAGWTWAEAWPMWVILFGVGGLASAVLERHRPAARLWSLAWPVAAVVVGAILLLSTTGNLGLGPGQLLAWWPIVVLLIGIWFIIGAVVVRDPDVGTASLGVPLAGAPAADVRIRFGGGELNVGPADPGMLLVGTFGGGVVQRSAGPGQIELEPDSMWPFGWKRPLDWRVGLTDEVPLDLRLETGANRSSVDLSALSVRRLTVKTGASETLVRLPAAGSTMVRAEVGVASLTLEVPSGVAARIHSRMTLGETSVDEGRFARSVDGWQSADFGTSPNRVEIDVEGGLGSLRVR